MRRLHKEVISEVENSSLACFSDSDGMSKNSQCKESDNDSIQDEDDVDENVTVNGPQQMRHLMKTFSIPMTYDN